MCQQFENGANKEPGCCRDTRKSFFSFFLEVSFITDRWKGLIFLKRTFWHVGVRKAQVLLIKLTMAELNSAASVPGSWSRLIVTLSRLTGTLEWAHCESFFLNTCASLAMTSQRVHCEREEACQAARYQASNGWKDFGSTLSILDWVVWYRSLFLVLTLGLLCLYTCFWLFLGRSSKRDSGGRRKLFKSHE